MKDFTKSYFRKQLVFLFVVLIIFIVVMLVYLDRGASLGAIPFATVCVLLFIIICVEMKAYLAYKHNTNVLEGTITNVSNDRLSYQMVIRSDEQNYVASYDFVFKHFYSSYMKDKVVRKCSFVVNKKGKAYIKYFA